MIRSWPCYNSYVQYVLWLGSVKPPNWVVPYPVSIALVLFGCGLVFSLITFLKGGPSSVLAAIAKSGFTAAFTLIFVSEIGDKVITIITYTLCCSFLFAFLTSSFDSHFFKIVMS